MNSFAYKLISALLIGGIIASLFWVSFTNNDSQWIYPLDDTYIHLSIAQNLWQAGNWSVVPSPVQFSSSSPLYTLILTLLGAAINFPSYLPLVINILIGAGLFFWLGHQIFRAIPSPFISLFVFIGALLLLPFHLLVLLGMEHLLHVWLSLLFIQEVIPSIWENKKESFSKGEILLFIFLLSLCRYESLFLYGSAGLVFFFHRKYLKGILLALGGGIPIIVLGTILWSRGATFLPLSILAKSQLIHLPHNLFSPLEAFLAELYANPFMLVLALALLFLPPICRLVQTKPHPILLLKIQIYLFTLLFHMLAASVGGYRYEAYLVAMGLLLIIEGYSQVGMAWQSDLTTRRWLWAAGLLWSFPLIIRSLFFTTNFILSTQNIYHQQIQMARFLEAYYPESCIAANDIGAITYFNDITLLDFAFIGDQELYEMFTEGKREAQDIQRVAQEREVSLAIVYKSFTRNTVPSNWKEVASWTIPNNFICADETVTFYAVSDQAKRELRSQLKEFDELLPHAVSVDYVEE